MFTTLTKLFASPAQKDRVDQLERALKSVNPGWQNHYLIPIVAVGLYNVVDDVRWVQDATDVHVLTELDDEIASLLAQNSLTDYTTLMGRGKQGTINKVMAIYNQVASRRNISSELLNNPLVAKGNAKYRKVEAVKPLRSLASLPVEETPAVTPTLNELADNAQDLVPDLAPIEVDHSFFEETLNLMPREDLVKILTTVGAFRGDASVLVVEGNVQVTLNLKT